MLSVPVFDQNREQVDTLDLDESVFGVEVREHLFYTVVRYQLAKRRQGTHKVKGRAEVSGGGRKPFKQKGTGRARQGSTRAPHWRGGGVVFGPTPRSHAHALNKKVRRAALCAALSRRTEEGCLTVLSHVDLPPRTREFRSFMQRFEVADLLLVVAERDENVTLAARNLPNALVLPVEGLNVYDILRHSNLALTRAAVERLHERLGVASG